MGNIALSDDGTMDTVLVCTDCREEFRYNFDAEWHDDDCREDKDCGCYDVFVSWAIEDAESEHDCESEG